MPYSKVDDFQGGRGQPRSNTRSFSLQKKEPTVKRHRYHRVDNSLQLQLSSAYCECVCSFLFFFFVQVSHVYS